MRWRNKLINKWTSSIKFLVISKQNFNPSNILSCVFSGLVYRFLFSQFVKLSLTLYFFSNRSNFVCFVRTVAVTPMNFNAWTEIVFRKAFDVMANQIASKYSCTSRVTDCCFLQKYSHVSINLFHLK